MTDVYVYSRSTNEAVPKSQKTHVISMTKTNKLMLSRKIIAVYCEHHARHMTALFCEVLSFLTLQVVVKIPLSFV